MADKKEVLMNIKIGGKVEAKNLVLPEEDSNISIEGGVSSESIHRGPQTIEGDLHIDTSHIPTNANTEIAPKQPLDHNPAGADTYGPISGANIEISQGGVIVDGKKVEPSSASLTPSKDQRENQNVNLRIQRLEQLNFDPAIIGRIENFWDIPARHELLKTELDNLIATETDIRKQMALEDVRKEMFGE